VKNPKRGYPKQIASFYTNFKNGMMHFFNFLSTLL
jgi:hypothetical protein